MAGTLRATPPLRLVSLLPNRPPSPHSHSAPLPPRSWVTSIPHLAEAAALLSKCAIKPESIVSHRFPLEQGGDAYALANTGQCAKVVIVMSDAD